MTLRSRPAGVRSPGQPHLLFICPHSTVNFYVVRGDVNRRFLARRRRMNAPNNVPGFFVDVGVGMSESGPSPTSSHACVESEIRARAAPTQRRRSAAPPTNSSTRRRRLGGGWPPSPFPFIEFGLGAGAAARFVFAIVRFGANAGGGRRGAGRALRGTGSWKTRGIERSAFDTARVGLIRAESSRARARGCF